MKIFLSRLAFIICCVSGVFCNQKTQLQASTINSTDSALISSTYQECLFAIKTANEALTRSTSNKTKELARKNLQQKTVLKNDLEELAGRKLLKIPLDITGEQNVKWKSFVVKKGWEFDKQYLNLDKDSYDSLHALYGLLKKSQDIELRKVATRSLSMPDHKADISQLLQLIEARVRVDTLQESVLSK